MKLDIFNGKPQETCISLALEQINDRVFVKMVDPTTGADIEGAYLLGFEVVDGMIQVCRCPNPNEEFVTAEKDRNCWPQIRVKN